MARTLRQLRADWRKQSSLKSILRAAGLVGTVMTLIGVGIGLVSWRDSAESAKETQEAIRALTEAVDDQRSNIDADMVAKKYSCWAIWGFHQSGANLVKDCEGQVVGLGINRVHVELEPKWLTVAVAAELLLPEGAEVAPKPGIPRFPLWGQPASLRRDERCWRGVVFPLVTLHARPNVPARLFPTGVRIEMEVLEDRGETIVVLAGVRPESGRSPAFGPRSTPIRTVRECMRRIPDWKPPSERLERWRSLPIGSEEGDV